MADDILFDARLVVGGLWPSRVRHVSKKLDGTVVHYRGVDGWRISWDDGTTEDVPRSQFRLRLPGPLGLGAAGLAVRIAERLGIEWTGRGYRSLVQHLVYVWGDTYLWARDITGGLTHIECLARISEYLAATDALCAAVGLELEAGEVADWQHAPVAEDGDRWMLSTKSGEHYFVDSIGGVGGGETLISALYPHTTGDDPRESLLACWREVCGG